MAGHSEGALGAGGDGTMLERTEALAANVAPAVALMRPGDPEHAAYPLSEAAYWREAYAGEPYRHPARTAGDYGPAYELGWVGYHLYGGPFEIAERVVANDWLVRKGVSTLSWEEARPAVRAAWQRAEYARSYATDGSAPAGRVAEVLEALIENARDGELGLREAAGYARDAALAARFEILAGHCAQWARHWADEVAQRGGAAAAGGTVAGAAQRVWLQLRGLFGAADDEALLEECERGLDDIAQHCRDALQADLPRELHESVMRQLEQAQRHADHLRWLREDAGRADPAAIAEPAPGQ